MAEIILQLSADKTEVLVVDPEEEAPMITQTILQTPF